MLEVRLRSKASSSYLDSVKGKVLARSDVDLLITGGMRVYKPNGDLLLVYLPKAIPDDINTAAYAILQTIKGETKNRGMASGGRRAVPKLLGPPDPDRTRYRTYAVPVESSLVGVIEESGLPAYAYCRLTAWTGRHLPQWQALQPYLQQVAQCFAQYVPERHAAQMRQVAKTRPEWIVPGTPFTTVTVNADYATGVHQDKGDFEPGFSCLSVMRRGTYSGAFLTFPEYRTGVDMQDGDLLLMDAHEWHGNTQLVKESDDAQRISAVFYYRTAIADCGSFTEEQAKGDRLARAK